jgi:hypothetical protein
MCGIMSSSNRVQRGPSSADIARRLFVFIRRSQCHPPTLCIQEGINPMTDAQRLIDYASRSNGFSRHPMVVLASCCRISPLETPPECSKTFDPTGSQCGVSRTVTELVIFRRQELTLGYGSRVKLSSSFFIKGACVASSQGAWQNPPSGYFQEGK